MGYGVLLIGYMLAFLFTVTDSYFFADVLGGAVMLAGFNKLSRFEKNYLYAIYPTFAFTALSFIRAILMVIGVDIGGIADLVLRLLKLASIAVLHYCMLKGTDSLAKAADVAKLAYNARRNLVISYIYVVALAVIAVLQFVIGDIANADVGLAYTVYVAALGGIIWMVLNLWLLYSCFGMLCVEADREYKPKESKIPLINKINAKIDSLDVIYHPEKPEKKEEEKQKHPKKKKKHK